MGQHKYVDSLVHTREWCCGLNCTHMCKDLTLCNYPAVTGSFCSLGLGIQAKCKLVSCNRESLTASHIIRLVVLFLSCKASKGLTIWDHLTKRQLWTEPGLNPRPLFYCTSGLTF